MLDKTILSTNLYSFFKTMSGQTNQQFASSFADKVDQWYCGANGNTIDVGVIPQGIFTGTGTISKINGVPDVLSTSIQTACDLIDSTKPNNAKEIFANSISDGYVQYTNKSIIECTVNGTAISGGYPTSVNGKSNGSLSLENDSTEMSISNYECPIGNNISLSPNITKGSVIITYTYEENTYSGTDDGEGNITTDYVNGIVDYGSGKISLQVDESYEDITSCQISYRFTSDFKGDVLKLLNELDVKENESETEYKTRMNGDSDKYFADGLADILYTQTTSVLLSTNGIGSLIGSVGQCKLY